MQCPKCHRDYINTTEPDDRGKWSGQNPHDHEPYKVFGYQCGYADCRFNAVIISVPINYLYHKTSKKYNKLDEIVKQFQQDVKKFFDHQDNLRIRREENEELKHGRQFGIFGKTEE